MCSGGFCPSFCPAILLLRSFCILPAFLCFGFFVFNSFACCRVLLVKVCSAYCTGTECSSFFRLWFWLCPCLCIWLCFLFCRYCCYCLCVCLCVVVSPLRGTERPRFWKLCCCVCRCVSVWSCPCPCRRVMPVRVFSAWFTGTKCPSFFEFCGTLLHIRRFPPLFPRAQRWRLVFMLLLLSCICMGNCTRHSGTSAAAAEVHLDVCNTRGAIVVSPTADLNAVNHFESVCCNGYRTCTLWQHATCTLCRNATSSIIGKSLYNLSNTTGFYNKTEDSWNACVLPQSYWEANKIQKHLVIKVWPTRMQQIPSQALDMFWHARGLNKYLLLALCLVCNLFTAGCHCIHRIMVLFGYWTDDICASPANAPATSCSEHDVSRIQALQQELCNIMLRKHASRVSNNLDDMTCLGWHRLSILSSLCKPFLREGQMCNRSAASVLYLFQVLCTHGRFQHVITAGHQCLRVHMRRQQRKDQRRRVLRKLKRLWTTCRSTSTSGDCSEPRAHISTLHFCMRSLVVMNLLYNAIAGSVLAVLGLLLWCVGFHFPTKDACQCASMFLVWLVNGDSVEAIMWAFVAYFWPLYPPSSVNNTSADRRDSQHMFMQFLSLPNFMSGDRDYRNTCFIASALNLASWVPAIEQELISEDAKGDRWTESSWKNIVKSVRGEKFGNKYKWTAASNGQDDAAELVADILWNHRATGNFMVSRTSMLYACSCRHSWRGRVDPGIMTVLDLPPIVTTPNGVKQWQTFTVKELLDFNQDEKIVEDLECGVCHRRNAHAKSSAFFYITSDVALFRINRYESVNGVQRKRHLPGP